MCIRDRYERSGTGAEMSKGTIQFNGNSTISANLQIAKDVTVHLAGDEVSVTVADEASGVAAAMHGVGNLMLGASSGTQTLEFTDASSCSTDGTSVAGDNTFNNVVVSGDVDVRCASSALTPSGFTITNSLVVNSGTLDLGGFDVTVTTMHPGTGDDAPAAGKVEIKSRVEGRGDFTLNPEAETAGLPGGDAPEIDVTGDEPPAAPGGVITVVATENVGSKPANYPIGSDETTRTGQIITAFGHKRGTDSTPAEEDDLSLIHISETTRPY